MNTKTQQRPSPPPRIKSIDLNVIKALNSKAMTREDYAIKEKQLAAQKQKWVVALQPLLNKIDKRPLANEYRDKIKNIEKEIAEHNKKRFEPLDRDFIQQAPQDIKELNQSIQNYNDNPTIETLQHLQQHLKNINHKYPDNVVSRFSRFGDALNKQLFPELRSARQHFKLPATLPSSTRSPSSSEACFAEILDQLTPNQFALLLSILSGQTSIKDGDFDKSELLKQLECFINDIPELKSFMQDHTITYLGGGNAKNIKIESKKTQMAFVMKYDFCFMNAKSAEQALRQAFNDDKLIPPTIYERQGSFIHSNKIHTCRIQLTPKITGGDLMACSQQVATQSTASLQKTYSFAHDIYIQLAQSLSKMQALGFVLPDGKSENILIEPIQTSIQDPSGVTKTVILNHEPRFLDLKSIKLTDQGTLHPNSSRNTWLLSTVFSHDYSPQEMLSHHASADKVHAYCLSLNLLRTIIGDADFNKHCKPKQFKSGAYFFSNQFPPELTNKYFNSPDGAILKQLIIDGAHPEPENRIGLQTFIERLQSLSPNTRLQGECSQALRSIQTLSPSEQEGLTLKQELSIAIDAQADLTPIKAKLDQCIGAQIGTILNDLETLKIGPYDTQMLLFIDAKKQACLRCTSPEALSTLKEELVQFQKTFTQHMAIIQTTLDRLEHPTRFETIKATFYKMTGHTKAHTIRETLKAVPIEDRIKLYDSQENVTKPIADFQQAVAYRRLYNKDGLVASLKHNHSDCVTLSAKNPAAAHRELMAKLKPKSPPTSNEPFNPDLPPPIQKK